MKTDDGSQPVLSERGLLSLVRQIEARARDEAQLSARHNDTLRELDGMRRDYTRLERDRDEEVRAYHKALEAALDLLKKRGVKKHGVALPPNWARNAKQIADYDDIPF